MTNTEILDGKISAIGPDGVSLGVTQDARVRWTNNADGGFNVAFVSAHQFRTEATEAGPITFEFVANDRSERFVRTVRAAVVTILPTVE